MKRITLFVSLLAVVLSFASCKKHNYKDFVGVWGVERIEYYNIDYAGNPISSTMDVYEFPLADANDGIDMVFYADKTGEIRDRSRDTVYDVHSLNPYSCDTIINPDTTLVTHFRYNYIEEESKLFLELETTEIYSLRISNFDNNSFNYVNEYYVDYIEKAYLKRISDTPTSKGTRVKPTYRPSRPGSVLSQW